MNKKELIDSSIQANTFLGVYAGLEEYLHTMIGDMSHRPKFLCKRLLKKTKPLFDEFEKNIHHAEVFEQMKDYTVDMLVQMEDEQRKILKEQGYYEK